MMSRSQFFPCLLFVVVFQTCVSVTFMGAPWPDNRALMCELVGMQRLKVDGLDGFIIETNVRSYKRSSLKFTFQNYLTLYDWAPRDLCSGPARVLYPRDWRLIRAARLLPTSSDVHGNEYGYGFRASFNTPSGPREVNIVLRGHTIVEKNGQRAKVLWHLFPDKGQVRWEPQ